MMYSGYVVEYSLDKNSSDKEEVIHFSQPQSTIERAHQIYDDLLKQIPDIHNIRICRLVCEPFNPKLY